jgi:hypothetical protein
MSGQITANRSPAYTPGKRLREPAPRATAGARTSCGRSSRCARSALLFQDLVVQFHDHAPDNLKDFTSGGGQVIVAAGTRADTTRFDLTTQPAIVGHPLQQWVQRARADIVPMTPELGQNPLADDRVLTRVMEDVHLPEAQENLSRDRLPVDAGHADGTVDDHRLRPQHDRSGIRSGFNPKRERLSPDDAALEPPSVIVVLPAEGNLETGLEQAW